MAQQVLAPPRPKAYDDTFFKPISLWLTTSADRLGRRRVLVVGALLMAGAGLVFAFTREPVVLLLAAREVQHLAVNTLVEVTVHRLVGQHRAGSPVNAPSIHVNKLIQSQKHLAEVRQRQLPRVVAPVRLVGLHLLLDEAHGIG